VNPNLVRRRFEVHVSGSLDDVKKALEEAVYKLSAEESEGLKSRVFEKFEAARTVSVCVEAPADVAAKLRASVAGTGDVFRDWIEVPSTGAPYPDRRSLARIDPDRLSPRRAGLRAARERAPGEREDVIVAVVDSGLTIDHPDIKPHNLWTEKSKKDVHGARFMDGTLADHDITDQDGHGTMLAGTILATAKFVDGVKIMALKFFDVTLQPLAPNAVAAIRFAVENGAHIINLSFDLGIGSFELEKAIHAACAKGVLVVMAAGNTGANNDEYPLIPAYYARMAPQDPQMGNRDEAIVVMATDWYDERAVFSNFGPRTVDLAAPGVGIFSTRASLGGGASRGEYGRYTGTSPAAAQVTGAAALLWWNNLKNGWTAAHVKKHLVNGSQGLRRLKCIDGKRLRL
jgi:subtilisin family serine protease